MKHPPSRALWFLLGMLFTVVSAIGGAFVWDRAAPELLTESVPDGGPLRHMIVYVDNTADFDKPVVRYACAPDGFVKRTRKR